MQEAPPARARPAQAACSWGAASLALPPHGHPRGWLCPGPVPGRPMGSTLSMIQTARVSEKVLVVSGHRPPEDQEKARPCAQFGPISWSCASMQQHLTSRCLLTCRQLRVRQGLKSRPYNGPSPSKLWSLLSLLGALCPAGGLAFHFPRLRCPPRPPCPPALGALAD